MKLKKQFKDFYDEICIHEESEDLKEKRDTLQKDKKIDFCNMVVQIYQEDSIKDIFKGFQKTIGKIEQFFC